MGNHFGTARRIRPGLAALAAVTALGWVATAPAASAADPGNGNSNGNSGTPPGQVGSTGTPGQSGQQHGQSGQPHGQSGEPHGQSGQPHGQSGQPHGHAGQPHGQSGQPHGHSGTGGPTAAPGQAHAHGPQSGTPGGSGATHGDPPGNNGTVKITPHGEDDGIPQNTPHVSCVFDVEWYGFDEGPDIISTVTFEMQAPTTDVVLSGTEPSQVFVGGDPATGAGTDSGFDGEATYHLGFSGAPQAKQGYHVRLTVHTPGSQGSDTKQKVFWVEPCTTTPGSAAGTTGNHGAAGQEHGVKPVPADAGVMGIVASAGESAAPASREAGDVPNAVAAGESGPSFDPGAGWLSLIVLGSGLALCGLALATRRRVG